jgi:hypothetical protein
MVVLTRDPSVARRMNLYWGQSRERSKPMILNCPNRRHDRKVMAPVSAEAGQYILLLAGFGKRPTDVECGEGIRSSSVVIFERRNHWLDETHPQNGVEKVV